MLPIGSSSKASPFEQVKANGNPNRKPASQSSRGRHHKGTLHWTRSTNNDNGTRRIRIVIELLRFARTSKVTVRTAVKELRSYKGPGTLRSRLRRPRRFRHWDERGNMSFPGPFHLTCSTVRNCRMRLTGYRPVTIYLHPRPLNKDSEVSISKCVLSTSAYSLTNAVLLLLLSLLILLMINWISLPSPLIRPLTLCACKPCAKKYAEG